MIVSKTVAESLGIHHAFLSLNRQVNLDHWSVSLRKGHISFAPFNGVSLASESGLVGCGHFRNPIRRKL